MLRKVLSSGTNDHDAGSIPMSTIQWIEYVFNTFSRPSYWVCGLTGDRCIDGLSFQTIGVGRIGRLGHREPLLRLRKVSTNGWCIISCHSMGYELYVEIQSCNLEKIPSISTCKCKHTLSLKMNNVKYVQ